MSEQHVDVLIVGAGISGIDAACRLAREFPGRSYRVLERRRAIGGTWDLFRYPGVRSDSDMYTFGYDFRPWPGTKVLADGPAIRDYVTATAAEYGVTERIRFGRRVRAADWSSELGRWQVDVVDEDSGRAEAWSCDFLIMATGYYDYDRGYRPDFAGEADFTGQIVHPQHWPDDLVHAGKRVAVIGSGATAVTLVPALARDAAHVTMVQRSPTYVVSLPAVDGLSRVLARALPDRAVYRLARARNIAVQRLMYAASRRRPDLVRRLVLAGARKHLGEGADLRHFSPAYDPWDQRLCVIPDGDLFAAIHAGRADVVTDTVDTFTPGGLRLGSGAHVDAELVVVATGLRLQLLGGAELRVDGEPVPVHERLTYKGVLLEGVPNAALIFGYTNASWTLKADIACAYLVRLLRFMDARGHHAVVAHAPDGERTDESIMSSLTSGYVRRGSARLPRQGRHGPWRVRNDYLRDAPALRRGAIDDGVLGFSRRPRPAAAGSPR